MFFHLQYIHLFRPFLKYNPSASPLPPHVSPRRICTANAGAISKLTRLYKKTWNLRQICNIAVYMIHSACTIHMLNLPEKTAKRDITHGIKHLEEIAEDWLCARRTMSILSVLARKWNVELPEEASGILQRTDEKWGGFNTADVPSPKSHIGPSPTSTADLAGSPMATRPEQYSPVEAFANTSLPPDIPGTSADVLVATPSLVGINGGRPPGHSLSRPRSFHQHQQQVSMSSMGGIPDMSNWAGQPGIPQQMPRYRQQQQQPQGYTSATNVPPNPRSRSAVRNMTQNTQAFQGLDQDWFLNDGAKWHQNFDAWELGASPISTDGQSQQNLFMFAGGNTPAAAGGGAGFGAGDAGNSNGGVTRPGSEDRGNQGGYDSLSSLSGNSTWLPPGLD